ncbi:SRPBCC family protein [Metabacillus halosaccharovorans]|uniref:SRPBCC family protein n=1 Tax=Metabacillus halosaccharovorans TaxID=930124 RepID=UPI0020419E42|nr:SRPBCC family protein [Metabacillus halosaccharovorans]MCM3439605.1 SRPBCC family protein [Metabacillus halosaccharovorans]
MNTEVTAKMKIRKPTNVVFEAIVDPEKIGNFWFSSSSERWEQGKKVILKYDEYHAEGVINIVELKENKKIAFSWGEEHNEKTIVTMMLKESDNGSTIIEVNETGLKEEDPEVINKMMGQKEGWVYMLSCLKCYVENDINNMRASLIH